jgi:hypothetical protein
MRSGLGKVRVEVLSMSCDGEIVSKTRCQALEKIAYIDRHDVLW